MKIHIYTVHGGFKDYKCDSCDKSFTQTGDLKGHILAVHKGEKGNKCNFCEKSFYAVRDLTRHKHAMHDAKITNVKYVKNSFLILVFY